MENEENMEAKHGFLFRKGGEGMKWTQPLSYPRGWVGYSKD
jgi:hypothetical protein